jgi:hypothetical protein
VAQGAQGAVQHGQVVRVGVHRATEDPRGPVVK